ncbi:MAG: hypothetical protein LBC25_02455 [Holosporales bacterium]|jgi:hypothetical protein|nr:hypothetical protein [Holosporales bacterium]
MMFFKKVLSIVLAFVIANTIMPPAEASSKIDPNCQSFGVTVVPTHQDGDRQSFQLLCGLLDGTPSLLGLPLEDSIPRFKQLFESILPELSLILPTYEELQYGQNDPLSFTVSAIVPDRAFVQAQAASILRGNRPLILILNLALPIGNPDRIKLFSVLSNYRPS